MKMRKKIQVRHHTSPWQSLLNNANNIVRNDRYYAVLWPVLNGISITRSPVEIPFRALLFVGIK